MAGWILTGGIVAFRRHLDANTPAWRYVVIGNLLPALFVCLLLWLDNSHRETPLGYTRGARLSLRIRGFLDKSMSLWMGYACAMHYSMAALAGVFMTMLSLDVILSRVVYDMEATSTPRKT